MAVSNSMEEPLSEEFRGLFRRRAPGAQEPPAFHIDGVIEMNSTIDMGTQASLRRRSILTSVDAG